MKIKTYVLGKVQKTKIGARLITDKRYRVISKAVCSLIFDLLFAFYNGILGVLSSSLIFIASACYYLLLSGMRFSAVFFERKRKKQNERLTASLVGIMLIILSVIFHVMVIVGMKNKTAVVYGKITMIVIATFTFTKITVASVSAVKHRGESSRLYKSINSVRYSEVAVSLLAMQKSMLVSFEGADEKSALILNAFTGAAVCFFILALGVLTLKNAVKINDEKH